MWYRHACHFHLLRDWGSRKLNDIADLGLNADLPDSQTWCLNHHPELLWTQSLGSSIMRCLYLSSLPWSQVLTETLPCLKAPDVKHCFPDVVSLSPCNTPGMKSSHSQWLLKGGKNLFTPKHFMSLAPLLKDGASLVTLLSPRIYGLFSSFNFIPLSVPTSLLGDAQIPHLQPNDLEAVFWEFSLRLSYVTERRFPM